MSKENMTVDELIVRAFEKTVLLKNELNEINVQNYKTRLIYPIKRRSQDNDVRISEQELKQIFIQVLNEENNEFLYSIETPTFSEHRFTGQSYRSGNIDLCLYTVYGGNSTAKRKYLLEFKALNSGPYESDFNKLAHGVANEETKESIDTFFIHILSNFSSHTKKTIIRDYKISLENFKKSNNNLVIYLLTLNNTHERNIFENINIINNPEIDKTKYKFINNDNGYYKIELSNNNKNNFERIFEEFYNENYERIN